MLWLGTLPGSSASITWFIFSASAAKKNDKIKLQHILTIGNNCSAKGQSESNRSALFRKPSRAGQLYTVSPVRKSIA
jgi:hypothetical protein